MWNLPDLRVPPIEAARINPWVCPDFVHVLDGSALALPAEANSVTVDRDISGVTLPRGIPVAVSDAAAARLTGEPAMVVTPPTYHAKGSGCC